MRRTAPAPSPPTSSPRRSRIWCDISGTTLPRSCSTPRWHCRRSSTTQPSLVAQPSWLAWMPRDSRPSTGCDTPATSTGVTARAVRELGGDVAKMLFYLRPDRQGADSRVGDEIRDLAKACEEEGLLLIVEVLTYRLEDESEEDYQAAFPQLVADAARIAVECGAKVLKLPYPGSAEASAAVTAAASGRPVGSPLGRRRPRDVHQAGGDRGRQRGTWGDGRPVPVEGQPRRLT